MTQKQVFFFDYHEKAYLEHADKRVWRPIREHVKSDEFAQNVLAGLDTALGAAGLFYEGVQALGVQLDVAGASIPKA